MSYIKVTVVFYVRSRKTNKQDRIKKVENRCVHGQVQRLIRSWEDELGRRYIILRKEVETKVISEY